MVNQKTQKSSSFVGSDNVDNLLIKSLPIRQRTRFLKLCSLYDLEFGTVLCEVHQPNKYIYFPITGFISSIAIAPDHSSLELGLIGNEGMLGACLALGVNKAPLQAVVQGAGTAWRMPAKLFEQQLLITPKLVTLLNRYNYLLIQQLARAAVCIHVHDIEARLARWLLMTNDRAHRDNFYITHVFLAQMLGVRRSGVTTAASTLREKSLIEYDRGNIKILNREGLELIACSCYSVIKSYYKALLPV